MSTKSAFLLGAAVAALVVALAANAARPPSPPVSLGVSSQQAGPSRASVSASIAVRSGRPGRKRSDPSGPGHATSASDSAPPYPSLPADTPLLQNPQPLGANTFWYADGSGHVCVYVASTSPLCYTVTTTGGQPARPQIDPAAIAASIAAQLELSPGRVQTSPAESRGGLTGAESWFWLAPAPAREELSIALGGERVTVGAEPSVEWRFGDGATVAGGPGSPYAAGPPPRDSVRHRYETRCLPGDAGRNPYVLPSCGPRGYEVAALVHWTISFAASGPVVASGELPSRTTTAAVVYPVQEARAFLVGGGTG